MTQPNRPPHPPIDHEEVERAKERAALEKLAGGVNTIADLIAGSQETRIRRLEARVESLNQEMGILNALVRRNEIPEYVILGLERMVFELEQLGKKA